MDTITRAHAASRGTYGYRRITAELRDNGCVINRKKVARLMRLAGLRGVDRRHQPGKPGGLGGRLRLHPI